MGVKTFLTKEQQSSIIQAIIDAEKATSGEIRVHLESTCKGNVLDNAAHVFKKLKMHKTALRNGVLIYLAVNDRKFAILGDGGINAKVPENFWDQIKETMVSHFATGDFTNGLKQGILMVGDKLKAYYPIQSNDTNELSNEISFGS
jgi:uncharacterized membrane protein